MIYKILRITAMVLPVLIMAFVIAALLGPDEFHVERRIVIHAPRRVVFGYIADYRSWPLWSGWRKNIDSSSKYEYSGPRGQADAEYRWSGPGRIGQGEMHTTELAEDVSFVSHVTYLRPFRSQCVISFTLDSAGPDDTGVTAVVRQNYPFTMRPMMLLRNAEKMLGPGYDRDLANLKKLSEDTTFIRPSAMQAKEIQWEKKTYVAHREVVPMRDLTPSFQKWAPKVYQYITAHKIQPAGPVTGLYFTWDTSAQATDLAVAVPVKSAKNVSGDYRTVIVDASRAVSVDYYGPYDRMKPAHELIHKYIADNGLQMTGLSIEEYISDPGIERDSSKILTRITYLIK
jgi:effector-binding domain-containing protein